MMGSDKKECSHFSKAKIQDKNDKTEEKKKKQIRMRRQKIRKRRIVV